MNIDNITIGQARELAGMFSKTDATCVASQYIGQYVIVRSRNEGVNAGKVVAADGTGVVLQDARRIWYHRPANKDLAWYEGVAVSGVSDDSKLSVAVGTKAIIEDYSITACTAEAEASIRGANAHGQR